MSDAHSDDAFSSQARTARSHSASLAVEGAAHTARSEERRGPGADGGGGEFELPYGYVALYEDGLAQHADVFDPDDRQALIARYTELGGGLSGLGDTPPELLWAEFARRFAGLPAPPGAPATLKSAAGAVGREAAFLGPA